MGRSSTNQSHKTGRIDDTATSLKPFIRVLRILTHGEDGVFASPPNALKIDLHSHIPNTLLRIQRIFVLRVHDTWLCMHCDQLSMSYYDKDDVYQRC